MPVPFVLDFKRVQCFRCPHESSNAMGFDIAVMQVFNGVSLFTI